jgi:hypothetical protein
MHTEILWESRRKTDYCEVLDVAVPLLRRLVACFPLRRRGFEFGSGHVGFVVDKAALGQAFSEYPGFPCQAFHRLLHTHHSSSSGAGTIG